MYLEPDVRAATLEYFNGNQLATDVWISKYALRDKEENLLELTPDDMHKRLAKEFARVEANYANPLSEERIYNLFKSFRYIIPQGSPMSVIGDNYRIQSTSNCIVIGSPFDSYGGICRTDQELTQLMKRRCGVGFDISSIRPKGMTTSNAARTTDGIALFAERWSNTCREVAQDGRRGAEIQTCSVHHPEILTFVNLKRDLKKVTGANLTVALTDEFLQAVEAGTTYEQRWPVVGEPQIRQQVDARMVWDQIVSAARDCAEPGLAFLDTIKRTTPSDLYPKYATVACNPCCFRAAGNTYVKVKDPNVRQNPSMKAIQNLKEGDLVYLQDKGIYVPCSGWFHVGNEEVFRVVFSEGQVLEITSNHKLQAFSSPNWDGLSKMYELSQLKPGDRVCSYPLQDQVGYYWASSRIESIESIGYHDVGCIEVPGHGYFSANNLVSGNSEIWMCPDDSCRLMVLNLFSYVVNPYTDKARIDYQLLSAHTKDAQRLMDDLVDLEIECIDKILAKIESDPEPEDIKSVEKNLWTRIRNTAVNIRRTGLGVTAYGDVIAAMGFIYGSEESVDLVEKIQETVALSAHASSIQMAKERGAFPAFDYELEKNSEYMKAMILPTLKEDWKQYGRRNIALTTIAPTGSVSIEAMLSCIFDTEALLELLDRNISPNDMYRFGTTSGIEPTLFLEATRRRKVTNDQPADFIDPSGDHWVHYKVDHPGHALAKAITGKEDTIYSASLANDIDWRQRVKLQAAAQRWVDHAISSTINLPEDVTKEEVAEIYMTAWKAGCKGITVYREGSRTGVIVDANKQQATVFNHMHAPKRPELLQADVYDCFLREDGEVRVIVGLLDEKPFEVFLIPKDDHVLPNELFVKKSSLKKGNRYSLVAKKIHVKDIVSLAEPNAAALTRLVSMTLRHGAAPEFVMEQLNKAKDTDFGSLPAILARVLKNYVKGKAKGKCKQCSKETLVYIEGCVQCTTCGWSKC